MIKVLNLYSGLGGNRKLWTDVKVTAVEYNPEIAAFYADQFRDDIVLVEDAHQFLLDHYGEFDFIWSSRECTTHSRSRYWASKGGRYKPEYPDLKLYEEIIFLQHFFGGKWVVENVYPYYKPLIKPTMQIERHLFWSNFGIKPLLAPGNRIFNGNIEIWQNETGFDLTGYEFSVRKDKILRNCVHPEIGLHVFKCAFNHKRIF